MTSEMLGNPTSAEVVHVSAHGLWLNAGGHEYFAPFSQFPWFREATISQLLCVEQPAPGHFYWPLLDIDLSSEILRHPERFSLVAH